jgi:hypothetical protein
MLVGGGVDAQHAKNATTGPWGQIRRLARDSSPEGSAELLKYLESLTPAEMLTAARQACDERAAYTGKNTEATPEAVAEMDVVLCLHYYFDKVDRDEGSATLLQIVGNTSESSLFRRAIVAYMYGDAKTRFQQTFQAYTQAHRSEVYDMLVAILENDRDDVVVRKQVIDSLGRQIGKEASAIIESDDNVREAVREKRRHSDSAVFVNELIRTNDIALTEDTVEKLKPVEARALVYIGLLGTILANDATEPEQLRKHAKRSLEGYRRSVLRRMDAEVEKALASAGN